MLKRASLVIALACLFGLSEWVAHLPAWVWHPLLGKGYQLWSGIASDVSEITLPVECVTIAVTVRAFLHSHFECHNAECRRLGFHPVEGTPYRTCWQCHPHLGGHETKHGVHINHIHAAHRQARHRHA